MQFNRKVHANNPAVTRGTTVVQCPAAAAGAPLEAALGAGGNGLVGMLVSASTGNNVFIRSATGAAGTGVLISTGQSLYIPLVDWPTNALTYECASAVSVMVFSSEFPSLGA